LNDIINKAIDHWRSEIKRLDGLSSIVALNFGLQKIESGFEIYLEGFSWHDDQNDLWLLDVKWSPADNYISLQKESLKYNRLELLAIYKDIVTNEVTKHAQDYKRFEVVTVALTDGTPIRVK